MKKLPPIRLYAVHWCGFLKSSYQMQDENDIDSPTTVISPTEPKQICYTIFQISMCFGERDKFNFFDNLTS